MQTIAPFPFEDLRHYSEEEAMLINRISRTLPVYGTMPAITEGITDLLKKYIGEAGNFHYESFGVKPASYLTQSLPENFVSFLVSFLPLQGKLLFEISRDMARFMIDRLLGGKGDAGGRAKPLTPLDEGMLQFLFIKILKQVNGSFRDFPYQLQLDRCITHSTDILNIVGGDQKILFFTFRIQFQKEKFYCRIMGHRDLLEELLDHITEEGPMPNHKMLLNRVLLWAEAGKVVLSPGELDKLEAGDILLLDETYPDFDGKNLSGEIVLRLGEDAEGGISARLLSTEGRLKVQLEKVFN